MHPHTFATFNYYLKLVMLFICFLKKCPNLYIQEKKNSNTIIKINIIEFVTKFHFFGRGDVAKHDWA